MNLAVLGPGLLGASIALACRRLPGVRVSLWGRRPEAVEALRSRGIGDLASTNLAEVVQGADLVVLCVPIGAMAPLARELMALLPSGTLVTDVGSVKGPVVAELSALLHPHLRFVGSHPMAGSEQQGLEAARADLYDGHVCIVTPGGDSDPEAVVEISRFWEGLGCRVSQLRPEEHDSVVAAISHVPHALAAVLVNAVAAQIPKAFAFAGPGFRDTTRIASGGPEMWSEILLSNRAAVRNSAEAMVEKFQEFLKLLDSASPADQAPMIQFLTSAKAQRDLLRVKA